LFYWKAGACDKIVLFERINSSLAILTFVEKHPVYRSLEMYIFEMVKMEFPSTFNG